MLILLLIYLLYLLPDMVPTDPHIFLPVLSPVRTSAENLNLYILILVIILYSYTCQRT